MASAIKSSINNKIVPRTDPIVIPFLILGLEIFNDRLDSDLDLFNEIRFFWTVLNDLQGVFLL